MLPAVYRQRSPLRTGGLAVRSIAPLRAAQGRLRASRRCDPCSTVEASRRTLREPLCGPLSTPGSPLPPTSPLKSPDEPLCESRSHRRDRRRRRAHRTGDGATERRTDGAQSEHRSAHTASRTASTAHTGASVALTRTARRSGASTGQRERGPLAVRAGTARQDPTPRFPVRDAPPAQSCHLIRALATPEKWLVSRCYGLAGIPGKSCRAGLKSVELVRGGPGSELARGNFRLVGRRLLAGTAGTTTAETRVFPGNLRQFSVGGAADCSRGLWRAWECARCVVFRAPRAVVGR